MKTLQLHSFGRNDYITAIKSKFNLLKNSVLNNIFLTEKTKQKKVKVLKKELKRRIKNSDKSLY